MQCIRFNERLVGYMKKILTMLLIAAMLMTVVGGCSNESEQVSGDSQSGAFSKNDLYLTISGEEYRCDVYIDDIIAVFGEDYEYSEGMSCAYDGIDKNFSYEDLDVYTRPDGDKDIVIELCSYSEDAKSSAGIGVGGNADEVREAYGEPTSSTSRLMSYEIAPASDDSEGASLYFRLDDSGVITAVGITAEVLIGE